MTERVLEGGTTTRVLEGGTTVRILEGSGGTGLDQNVKLLYNSTKVGTSSSNIRFEEIDKLIGIKLR